MVAECAVLSWKSLRNFDRSGHRKCSCGLARVFGISIITSTVAGTSIALSEYCTPALQYAKVINSIMELYKRTATLVVLLVVFGLLASADGSLTTAYKTLRCGVLVFVLGLVTGSHGWNQDFHVAFTLVEQKNIRTTLCFTPNHDALLRLF